MKILYVAPLSPWPADVGARMREYGVLKMLAKRHDVAVALVGPPPSEIVRFESNREEFRERFVLAYPVPSLLRRALNRPLERYRPIRLFQSWVRGRCENEFRDVVEKTRPDLIWFFRINTVWLTDWRRSDIPAVVDMDDLESRSYARAIEFLPSRWRRLYARWDYPRFVALQRSTAQACDVVLVANPSDVAEAQNVLDAPVRALPNGYDYSEAPVWDAPRQRRVVFIGLLGYPPNRNGMAWFLREVWPRVRAEVPDARLDIGGRPTEEAKQWARLPGVRMCGFVEDAGRFIRNAAVSVAPIRSGSGTRIKILEAWARGVPVLSTTIGCEGLEAEDDRTLLIADAPEQFAARCVALLRRPELGNRLAQAAYQYAKARFDWSALECHVEEVVAQARLGRQA